MRALGLAALATRLSGRARASGPALGLVGLVLCLFRQPLFEGTAFFERDVHLMWYTQVEAFVSAVASGTWPVWNRLAGFGQPLWADANNQILYPPTWLHLLVRPWTYYTGFVVGHFIFAGFGILALARRLGVPPPGAWAAAAVWIAGGPLLSLAPMWNLLAGAAWLPWMVLAGELAQGARTPAATLAWGGTLAIPILVGAPEVALMGAACSATLAWPRVRQQPWRASAAPAFQALAFALGLSAGQWLPALEAAGRSARRALPEAMRTYWSIHPAALLETLLPVRLAELPLRSELRSTLFEPADPFLHSIYLGLPALGFALVGLRTGWSKRLLALGGLAALLAAGNHTPVYGWVVALAPPLRLFRFPAKAMILVGMCWALLVGSGVGRVTARDPGSLRRIWPISLITMALAALVLCGLPDLLEPLLASPLSPATTDTLRFRLAGAGVVALLLPLLAARPSPLAGVRWAGVVLVAAELAFAHRDLNPTAPRALFTYRPPILEAVTPPDHSRLYVFDYLRPGLAERYLKRAIPYQIVRAPIDWPLPAAQALGLRSTLFPPAAGAFGLEGSFDADVPALQPLPLYQLGQLLAQVVGTPAHLRLLQLAAVSRVVALHAEGFEDLLPRAELAGPFQEPLRVFDVPRSLPRAYAVTGVRGAGEAGVTALLAPDFDPERELILPDGPPATADPGFARSVEIEDMGAGRVLLQARLSAAGYVVLVNAYDPGWRVAVDGQSAPLVAANLVFCGVQVDAGQHRVEFVYRPPAVLWGLGLSAGTALAGALVLLWRGQSAAAVAGGIVASR